MHSILITDPLQKLLNRIDNAVDDVWHGRNRVVNIQHNGRSVTIRHSDAHGIRAIVLDGEGTNAIAIGGYKDAAAFALDILNPES